MNAYVLSASADVSISVDDIHMSKAQRLATFTRRRIAELTADDPGLRRAAFALRRMARGTKLGRRLKRKAVLGMAGAF